MINVERFELRADQLRKRCDPAVVNFKTTEDLEPVIGLVNQERVLEAISRAVNSQDKRSNLRIVQTGVTSRATAAIKELRREVRKRYNGESPDVPDICMVDVSNPNSAHRKVKPLILPSGSGEELQKDMNQFVENFRREVLEEFRGSEFAAADSSIYETSKVVAEKADEKTAEIRKKFGIRVERIGLYGTTLHILPGIDPKQVMTPVLFSETVRVFQLDPATHKIVESLDNSAGNDENVLYRIGIVPSTRQGERIESWLLDEKNGKMFILTHGQTPKGVSYFTIPIEHIGEWVKYVRKSEEKDNLDTVYYCVQTHPPQHQHDSPKHFVLDEEGKEIFQIVDVRDTDTQGLLYWSILPGQLQEWFDYVGFAREKREEFMAETKKAENRIRRMFIAVNRRISKESGALRKKTVGNVFDRHAKSLRRKYPQANWYFDELREYCSSIHGVLEHQNPAESVLVQSADGRQSRDAFGPFTVNILAGSKDRDSADPVPIIYEENPTFENLFGKIVRPLGGINQQGMHMITAADHMSLRAGSLLRANGGYLIIPMDRLIKEPFWLSVWNTLVKAIRNEKVEVEDFRSEMGFLPHDGLEQEAIPLNVTLMLITNTSLDMAFLQYLPEDYGFFRLKGELVRDMPRTLENETKVWQILGDMSRNSGMLHCNSEAGALFIEHSSRLADDQKKLTTNFNAIKELLEEADFWARDRARSKGEEAEEISVQDMRTALEHKIFRSNVIQCRMIDLMRDGIFKVDVTGSRVGRVNGLTVYDFEEYAFGKPCVISAQTRPGKQDIVNVEAEVEHAGPIQKKSVHIIAGFLDGKFFQNKLPGLHARLVFEQAYEGIEGDSASVAEFLSLLSRLSHVPLKQNLAVTGSCNQDGGVQAIGAVNQKVEGFFDTCKAFAEASKRDKLSGDQGVVLPKDNVRHLMLREDVVEAVRNGEFHVYAVSTLDEAVEIFTDKKAEDVYSKADLKLTKYSRIASKSRP